MKASLLSAENAGVLPATNATRYASVGICLLVGATAEVDVQHTMRAAGTFSNLNCYVSANAAASLATTVRFRKNTANGNQSVSIAAAATGYFEDTTNIDAIVAGDITSYSLVNSDLTGSPTIRWIHLLFDATTSTYTPMYASVSGLLLSSAATRYATLFGTTGNGSSSEARNQFKFRSAGTLQHLYVSVTTNASSASTTVRTRLNTANGAQSVSIGATSTGIFEDLVNTDTIAAGDLANLQNVTSGTPSITFLRWGCGFLTTTNVRVVGWAIPAGTATSGASQTKWFGLGGTTTGAATESFDQSYLKQSALVSNLATAVSVNAHTTATTVQTRVAGANGNQSVSIGSTATGLFEDTTNTDSLNSSQFLNFQFVTGSDNNSITFTFMTAHLQEMRLPRPVVKSQAIARASSW